MEIVGFPINSMVMFYSHVRHYQRVTQNGHDLIESEHLFRHGVLISHEFYLMYGVMYCNSISIQLENGIPIHI